MDFLEHFDKFLDTAEQSQLGKDGNHCYDLIATTSFTATISSSSFENLLSVYKIKSAQKNGIQKLNSSKRIQRKMSGLDASVLNQFTVDIHVAYGHFFIIY